MKNSLLIYGANGYTGELITRYAVERGLRPLIAGRNAAAIEALAEKHGLEYRVFSLDDNEKIDAALEEVDMVLHCAGPFSLTSSPMVDACLRNKKHYATSPARYLYLKWCETGRNGQICRHNDNARCRVRWVLERSSGGSAS